MFSFRTVLSKPHYSLPLVKAKMMSSGAWRADFLDSRYFQAVTEDMAAEPPIVGSPMDREAKSSGKGS